jgi:D-lactate dehydrogenase (cytochrome)
MDVVTDPDIIAGYLSDASNTHGHAEALVRPTCAADVAEVLRHCQARAIPVTVTARRTSTTGAPVPDGGWLLSTELLTQPGDIDHVGAGELLGVVQARAEAAGLHFPPDPTSRHECSVGAAIACNASGSRSFRYGPTRPWITEVEVVLPTGDILIADRTTPIPAHWPRIHWVEPQVKTAAGYFPADNLLDLLIGQEGTLGVITRARLRLIPRSADSLLLLAFFPDIESTLAFVATARAGAQRPWRPIAEPGALDPSAIEYYDGHCLDLVRQRGVAVPTSAATALSIEVEHSGEPPLERWWEALQAAGALVDDTVIADDERGRKRLFDIRHSVPAGINERVVSNGMPKVGTDFAVPDAKLAEMMALYAAVPLEQVCFGHIGDSHLHLNLLPHNNDELAEARRWYRQLALHAVSLGGSVSAEHGKLKRELLAGMVGPDVLATFRALKAVVDPAWILGRGTLLAHPRPAGAGV